MSSSLIGDASAAAPGLRPVREAAWPGQPLVSVVMITYRHERFVRQAIESVLMQETDFAVELVVGEDNSPDGTRDVVAELAREHPTVIRALLRTENLGMSRNVLETWKATRGQFIAQLEGDDYWIDPRKLQRQIDRFRSRPATVLCGSRVFLWQDGSAQPYAIWPSSLPGSGQPADLGRLFMGPDWVHSSTWMYPRDLVESFTKDVTSIDAVFDLGVALYAMATAIRRNGEIWYDDEVVGVYRRHEGGVFHGGTSAAMIDRAISAYSAVLNGIPPGPLRRTTRMALADSLLARALDQSRRRSERSAAWLRSLMVWHGADAGSIARVLRRAAAAPRALW